jgi:hypothetical protein
MAKPTIAFAESLRVPHPKISGAESTCVRIDES